MKGLCQRYCNKGCELSCGCLLSRLVEVGFEKMVNELDVKEAARLGMHTRPLTTAVVQQHLQDLGVDPEFGTHSHMRGLSGEPSTPVPDTARARGLLLGGSAACLHVQSGMHCMVRERRASCSCTLLILLDLVLTAGSACRWSEGEGCAGSSHLDEPAHAGAG